MPTPLLLVDNLFSKQQYPDHTITGTEEPTDHEAFRVGNGRRSSSDYWTSTSANTDMRIQSAFGPLNDPGRLRAFNCLVIDRGHNLTGFPVSVKYWSASTSSGAPTAWSGTIPAAGPGSVDDTNGVTTEEGVFIKRLDLTAGIAAAVDIAAMGSGLKPKVVGIWLGLAWVPPTPDFPWSEDEQELISADIQTDYGWMGSPTVNVRRAMNLSLRLPDNGAATTGPARLNTQLIAQRNPVWVIWDDQQAERAACMIRTPQQWGWRFDRDWINKRRIDIPLMEHEPKALA